MFILRILQCARGEGGDDIHSAMLHIDTTSLFSIVVPHDRFSNLPDGLQELIYRRYYPAVFVSDVSDVSVI